MAKEKAAFLDFNLEILPGVNLADGGVAERKGLVVDILLDVLQQVDNPVLKAVNGL